MIHSGIAATAINNKTPPTIHRSLASRKGTVTAGNTRRITKMKTELEPDKRIQPDRRNRRNSHLITSRRNVSQNTPDLASQPVLARVIVKRRNIAASRIVLHKSPRESWQTGRQFTSLVAATVTALRSSVTMHIMQEQSLTHRSQNFHF